MLKNPTYYTQPTFNTPRRRMVLLTALLVVVGILGTLLVITASANPPAAAEMRIQGLVNELQQDRLTASRHKAQSELENLGEDAVPALMVALRSDNTVMRRNAADMLGFIASPRSISSLQFALANDAAPTVRRNAAWALGEIDSFAALVDLQRAAIFDGSNLTRQTAQDSLARIRTRLALVTGIPETALNAFAVSQQNPNVIYAATRRNIVVTQDGGKTWKTLANALPSVSNTLAVSPTNAQVLYAGIDGSGMYKSADGGQTWDAINNGLQVTPGARLVVTAITVDPTEPLRIVIATGAMVGTSNVEFYPTGILISNNGGQDWQKLQENASREALTQLALKDNQLYALAGDRVVKYQFN